MKYSNAYKEVLVLFEYFLDEDDLLKIPSEQLEHIKKNANHKYTYTIDKTKPLEEQKISKEAKAIIVSLYKKYFLDDEKRKKVDEIIHIIDTQKKLKQTNNLRTNSFIETEKNKSDIKENEKLENKIKGNDEKALVEAKGIWKRFADKISKIYTKLVSKFH